MALDLEDFVRSVPGSDVPRWITFDGEHRKTDDEPPGREGSAQHGPGSGDRHIRWGGNRRGREGLTKRIGGRNDHRWILREGLGAFEKPRERFNHLPTVACRAG